MTTVFEDALRKLDPNYQTGEEKLAQKFLVANKLKEAVAAASGSGGGWKLTATERDGNEMVYSYTSLDGTQARTSRIPIANTELARENSDENLDLYNQLATTSQVQQGGYADKATTIGQNAYQAGQNQSWALNGIKNQQQASISKMPDQYGDAGALTSWGGANDQLSAFQGGNVNGSLDDSYSSLRQYADMGPGASAAQAQLDQALGSNTATQMALAQSGRNAGENAMASRQAAFLAADMGQRTAAEKASLRAQEEANWRQQKLSALDAASGVASNIESAEQGRNATTLSALQSAAGQYGNQYQSTASSQAQAATNRQSALGQLAAMQQQGYDQTAASYGQLSDANKTSASILSAANGMSLAAYQAGTGQQLAYDQSLIGVDQSALDRAAAVKSQQTGISANAAAASQLEDERNVDRYIGAGGAALGALGSVYAASTK